MEAIKEFAKKQNEFNDKIDQAVQGLTDDNKTLNEEIQELKDNIGGDLSTEDKALLDGILQRSENIAKKLAALDELTPPKIPGEPAPAGGEAETGNEDEGTV